MKDSSVFRVFYFYIKSRSVTIFVTTGLSILLSLGFAFKLSFLIAIYPTIESQILQLLQLGMFGQNVFRDVFGVVYKSKIKSTSTNSSEFSENS